jgi:type II secretory pathway pseudopilin PulG
MLSPLRSQSGITFLGVLFLVIVSGILLAAAGQSWHMVMKGEMEQELLFRGDQYRRAIEKWRLPKPNLGIQANRPLTQLKDLMQDPNALQKTRYLRRRYKDPITGKDFEELREPAGGVPGISGVVSTSPDEPLKQDNFPIEYLEFVGKKKYSDWKFVYKPTVAVAGQPNAPVLPPGTTIVQGTPGSPGGSATPGAAGTAQQLKPVDTRPSLW